RNRSLFVVRILRRQCVDETRQLVSRDRVGKVGRWRIESTGAARVDKEACRLSCARAVHDNVIHSQIVCTRCKLLDDRAYVYSGVLEQVAGHFDWELPRVDRDFNITEYRVGD